MASIHEGMSSRFEFVISRLNLLFSLFFIFECILKLIALGWKVYFHESWNKFDFTVVLASFLDLYLEIAGENIMSVFKSGPSIVRTLRVLRISRLLRLVKQF